TNKCPEQMVAPARHVTKGLVSPRPHGGTLRPGTADCAKFDEDREVRNVRAEGEIAAQIHGRVWRLLSRPVADTAGGCGTRRASICSAAIRDESEWSGWPKLQRTARDGVHSAG